MMIKIAHRGNTDGANAQRENHPDYIREALNEGYGVEIDVWLKDGVWLLGHDRPDYVVSMELLNLSGLFIHAKNLEALRRLADWPNRYHYFWHQEDDFTLTSKNFIWTYPNKKTTDRSIIVCHTLEECNQYKKTWVAGICSDFVGLI